jgi:hypothetical protein
MYLCSYGAYGGFKGTRKVLEASKRISFHVPREAEVLKVL